MHSQHDQRQVHYGHNSCRVSKLVHFQESQPLTLLEQFAALCCTDGPRLGYGQFVGLILEDGSHMVPVSI